MSTKYRESWPSKTPAKNTSGTFLLVLNNKIAVLLAGFGTNRLRCERAMKTAGRENPNHWVARPSHRAHGADEQNRSCSNKWAAKREKLRPSQWCFFSGVEAVA